MTFQPTERLGNYEILGALGAGGMGEVYRARDTKLGREVAIKVLPTEFANDPDLLARLEREARALAAVNHPGIATLFGVEEVEANRHTVRLLAMELIEGEDLAERLQRDGKLEIDEALDLARQVAAALEVAHEAGVVHRDLKPANIRVTPQDRAVVVDFGLAKPIGSDVAGSDGRLLTQSPTMTAPSVAGTILGTAPYMSPEQARGKSVDRRTDIWSFGCVLFEMLSGQRVFRGETVSDTLAAVLREELDWSRLPEQVPARVWRLLHRCLDRDASTRLRDIGEARVLLGDPDLDGARLQADQSVAPPGRAGWLRALPLVLTVLAMGWAAGWLLGRDTGTPTSNDGAVVRFTTTHGTFSGTYNRPLAISDDGRVLATAVISGIQIQTLASGEVRLLDADSGRRRMPFLSPDGERVAWWEAGRIHWSPIDGSAPPSSAPFPTRPTGATWGKDGFLYVGRGREGIWRVDSRGGEPESVAEVEEGELADGPELLPGEEWLLFAVARSMSGWDEARIVAHSLASGERRLVHDGGREVRYASSGHLLFVRQGVLLGVPFDSRSLSVRGTPRPLLEGVATSSLNHTGASYYDVSDDGTLVWAAALLPERVSLGLVDLAGNVSRLPIDPRPFTQATLSPSNRRIAAVVTRPPIGSELWVYPVDRSGGTLLASGGVNREPVWSHDGESVYFASDRSGTLDVWRQRVNSSEEPEIVVERIGDQVPSDVSRDGRWLYFTEESPGNRDLYRQSLETKSGPEKVLATESDEASPSLSPSGTHMVFESDESAAFQVAVLELATGRRWQAHPNGFFPDWSPDGSRIFFYLVESGAENDIAWVDVETEPELTVSEVRGRVEYSINSSFQFDVTRQGDRILTAVPVDRAEDGAPGAGATQSDDLNVVVNWFQELEAAIPTGG